MLESGVGFKRVRLDKSPGLQEVTRMTTSLVHYVLQLVWFSYSFWLFKFRENVDSMRSQIRVSDQRPWGLFLAGTWEWSSGLQEAPGRRCAWLVIRGMILDLWYLSPSPPLSPMLYSFYLQRNGFYYVTIIHLPLLKLIRGLELEVSTRKLTVPIW